MGITDTRYPNIPGQEIDDSATIEIEISRSNRVDVHELSTIAWSCQT